MFEISAEYIYGNLTLFVVLVTFCYVLYKSNSLFLKKVLKQFEQMNETLKAAQFHIKDTENHIKIHDVKIERLEDQVDRTSHRVDNHELRLTRIEM